METKEKADIEPLLSFIRTDVKKRLPQAEIVARKLEQGPPVGAPVEIRLYGTDFSKLDQAAVEVAHRLERIPGTEDVRQDLGPGAPTIEFRIDDAEAGRCGLTRADVAQAIYGRTRGIAVGQLYAEDDPVPILIRSSQGERMSVDSLVSISVPSRDGRFIPLSQIATLESVWRPAAIKHKNTKRVVTVSSQLADGYTFSDILSQFKQQVHAMKIPVGIEVAFGGEAEGSGEANTALLKSIPIGLLLLLIVLIAEFNSFRRLFIVLSTIPLAAAGVIPGLLIGRQPFGFMSLLGVIALVGIVVNNAIVLLDVVEERRKNGANVHDALSDAVSRRTRPILLTMGTTIAGLLPLAFSSSTLWPPLAWAMISGLLASTVLTLIVTPALYRVLFAKDKKRLFIMPKKILKVASYFSVFFLVTPALMAEPRYITLKDAMDMAKDRPAFKSSVYQAEASNKALEAEKRAAWFPVLTSQAAYSIRDREVETVIDVPGIGTFSNSIGDKEHYSASIVVVQPIFDPARNLYAIPAAEDDASAKQLLSQRKKQELSAEAGLIYLNLLAVDATIMTTESYVGSLKARLGEMHKMAEVGRVLEADLLKVLVFYEQAEQELVELRRLRIIAGKDLSRAVNSSSAVDVMDITDLSEKDVPEVEDACQLALKNRVDIISLKTSIEALKKKRAGVKAGSLPSLQAVGKWIWDEGLSSYSEDSWLEGSINVTWTPFASGIRFSKSSELFAQIQSLNNQLLEIENGISLEIRSRITAIENKKGAYKVEQRGIELASETLRVEHARHQEGRATTNDLLDAEAQLRKRRTKFEIARIDIIRAWIELWLSTGSKAYVF
ncbi:MAG: efflux RND transporter permease subunit [Proteobacteria bacterium]|nr:efflux RND transporter permease subunit [Pseudomonadota bacterium]